MSNQEVKGDGYQVQSDPASATVFFQGQIALGGPKDYAPIVTLLNEMAALQPKTITINVKELAFLNSSGISMLSKFVLGMRKKKETQMVVLGSKKMPWQSKSLKNLERLLPGLKLVVQ
ncbi:MAG: hypothetical protein PUP92_22560 [Rhizonema sp. PD38]|nr:hypothetical protein [Rhizonema sp. PD38]